MRGGLDPGETPRVLKFTSGRYETQWIKNVCTIGLSAGFIEPLESTTIHAMAMQIRFLTDLFLPYYTSISAPVLAEHYSRLVTMAYEDYLDFISMHYHAGRTDTEFWRDYQKPESVTDRNRRGSKNGVSRSCPRGLRRHVHPKGRANSELEHLGAHALRAESFETRVRAARRANERPPHQTSGKYGSLR